MFWRTKDDAPADGEECLVEFSAGMSRPERKVFTYRGSLLAFDEEKVSVPLKHVDRWIPTTELLSMVGEPKGEAPPPDIMVRVGGKPFRCDCGCNVFRRLDARRLRCNSCGSDYSGE